MKHLVPCPECQRHVRASEQACPFCSAALDLAGSAAPVLPRARLSRAATIAFGAALAASISTTACGSDDDGGGSGGSSGSGGTAATGGTSGAGGSTGGTSGAGGAGGTGGSAGSGGSAGEAGSAGASGAAGSAGSGTGGVAGAAGAAGAAGNSAAGAAGFAPAYGLPADAGPNKDDGGIGPLYGAPPN